MQEPAKTPFLIRAHQFWQDHDTQSLTIGATFLLAAANVPDLFGADLPSRWRLVLSLLFVLGLVAAIFSVITGSRKTRALSQVLDENASLVEENSALKLKNEELSEQVQAIPGHIYAITSFHLGKIANSIALDNECRISLFVPNGSGFHLRGRYSKKSSYDYKSTHCYTREQGVVGLALDSGRFFTNQLPDSNGRRYDRYVAAASTMFSLTEDQVRTWRMNSRLLYARVIYDHSGLKPSAVLLIESTNPNKFTEEELDGHIRSHEQALKELTLDMFKGLEISPEIARSVGL